MTTFEDGPAKGQTLMLHRLVRFLRVTKDKGKWDALDLINDEPMDSEKLYAYELRDHKGSIHTNPGGFFPVASYKFCVVQPTDTEMRKESTWHDWCYKNQ